MLTDASDINILRLDVSNLVWKPQKDISHNYNYQV